MANSSGSMPAQPAMLARKGNRDAGSGAAASRSYDWPKNATRRRATTPLISKSGNVTPVIASTRTRSSASVDRQPIEKVFGAGFLKQANCAGSLLTTAVDYGRFLAAVLSGRGLSGPLRDEMLRPAESLAGSTRLFGPPVVATPASGSESSPFWCLGWGGFRSSAGAVRFHVGCDSPEFENYAVLCLDKGLGLVVLTAGGRGPVSAAPVFVEAVLGPNDTPFSWAGYENESLQGVARPQPGVKLVRGRLGSLCGEAGRGVFRTPPKAMRMGEPMRHELLGVSAGRAAEAPKALGQR